MHNNKHWKALNPRQRRFVRLYTGDSDLHGNGTRCYMIAYGMTHEHSAQRCASRLIRKPHVAALINDVQDAAAEQIVIDAAWVRSQSLRLFKRAMGDEPFDQVTVERDSNTGQDLITHREKREYDASTAKAALQLIGQHRDVQAFSVTVEHNHTHHLEQRLAARSKLIEGRALVDDELAQLPEFEPGASDAGQLPDLAADPVPGQADPAQASVTRQASPGDSTAINNVHAAEPGAGIEAPTEARVAKRVHTSGGQSHAERDKEVPARERSGATGK